MSERKVQQARRYLTSSTATEAEAAGAAEAAGVGGGKPWGPRLFLGGIICIILYGTRFRNPLYESMLGTERVSLESADKDASLPLWYSWDSKTGARTIESRLNNMEETLGKALSSSSNPSETQKKVDRIREKGYTNGIIVNLDRANKFADASNMVELEKVFNVIHKYEASGGKIDEKQLNDVYNLGVNNKSGGLFTKAQQCANKGDASGTLAAVNDIKSLQAKARGESPNLNIKEEELVKVE
eukprot:UN31015